MVLMGRGRSDLGNIEIAVGRLLYIIPISWLYLHKRGLLFDTRCCAGKLGLNQLIGFGDFSLEIIILPIRSSSIYAGELGLKKPVGFGETRLQSNPSGLGACLSIVDGVLGDFMTLQ